MIAVFFSASLMATLFLMHCAVLGRAVLNVSESRLSERGLNVFFSLCLGLLVNMTVLLVLGLFGALHLPAILAVALALLTGAWALARWKPGSSVAAATYEPVDIKKSSVLEVATLVVIFLLCVAVSLHPPGHWDDTMYQLPLARHYVEQRAIVLHEFLRFPLFPQSMNLLFALGLMLGDALDVSSAAKLSTQWEFGAPEIFAQVFATLPLFVIALGLWGASQRYIGSGIPGLLAALTLFMIGPVKSTLGFAYVDNGLAMFCFASALAVALIAENRFATIKTWRTWPLIGGLLAGAACGIKYFGVVFATGLGVVLFVVTVLPIRRALTGGGTTPSILRTGTLYCLGVLLAGGAWYARSYLISGDPAHPAGAPIFGFFLWNEGDLALQYAEQADYGASGNFITWPRALIESGVALWFPAFAGLFLRRVPPSIRVMQAIFVGYMCFWFVVSQVPRYLGPVYGLGGFLAVYTLYRALRWATKSKHAPNVWPAGVVLLAAAVYASDRGIKYGKEFLYAEAVLQTNPGYTLYQHANAHITEFGPRLVQVGFENGIYFFQGTVVGDWFGPGRYRDTLQCESLPCTPPPLSDLQVTLQRHGARMLLLSKKHVVNLPHAGFEGAGWKVLASDEDGVLVATPH